MDEKIEIKNLIMYILFFALLHLFYTKITLKKVKLTIKSKYIFNNRIYKLMISSTDGIIYNVGNSLWFLHFTSSELWDSLKEGQTYEFTTVGIRIPIIDYYPTIIKIETNNIYAQI